MDWCCVLDDDAETIGDATTTVVGGDAPDDMAAPVLTEEELLQAELDSEREKQRRMLQQLLGPSTFSRKSDASSGAPYTAA